MPHKDIEADDPMELMGVVLPADAEATRDMAYVFAEEFARMGYDRNRLFSLFTNPYYGGAYGAYRALGEAEIRAIIDECIGAWGGAKFSISDSGFSIAKQKNEGHSPHPCPIQNLKSKVQNEGGEE